PHPALYSGGTLQRGQPERPPRHHLGSSPPLTRTFTTFQEDPIVPPQSVFGISVVFSFVAWGIVTHQYIWPALGSRPRADALRPILLLHSFRFVGLGSWSQALSLPSCRSHSHDLLRTATCRRRSWLCFR